MMIIANEEGREAFIVFFLLGNFSIEIFLLQHQTVMLYIIHAMSHCMYVR